MQSRLIQMERAQAQNFQPRINNNNQSSNTWQRKGQSSEQRPPNPPGSANQANEALPYCSACDAFHEEATCHVVKRIIDSRMVGTSNQVNVVGKEYHLSQENWPKVKEHSQEVRPFTSSYEKDMQLNQAHVIKNMKDNQARLIKNMELNQARLREDHAKQMSSMQNKFLAIEEKHIKELEIMEINHSNHIATIVEKCVQKMEAMRTDMQNHHEKEINHMQHCFMGMKAKNDKKLKIMEVNHSNQMSIIQNHMIAMEVKHTQEMKTMEANHITLQDRFAKIELNQPKLIVRHAR